MIPLVQVTLIIYILFVVVGKNGYRGSLPLTLAVFLEISDMHFAYGVATPVHVSLEIVH